MCLSRLESRPERGRFGRTADRGSGIDEQRTGTVHSTIYDEQIHTCRRRLSDSSAKIFDALGVLPPIFLKNAVAGAASATNASSRRGLYIVQSAEAPK